MVVVTSITSPARTPEGKIAQACSPPRSPSYSHYTPDYDYSGSESQQSIGGAFGFPTHHSSSAQCVPSDQQYVDVSKRVVPIPFPPRRPKIPHNRSTMVPVSRYVQKRPENYDLSRVRALWVHEEQTMQYYNGTPAQPLKDRDQELKHHCRHCRPPLHFFSSFNDQSYSDAFAGKKGFETGGNPFVTAAEMTDLPDVEIVEIAAVPDDMETECELEVDLERCGSSVEDMMALDSVTVGGMPSVVSASA